MRWNKECLKFNRQAVTQNFKKKTSWSVTQNNLTRKVCFSNIKPVLQSNPSPLNSRWCWSKTVQRKLNQVRGKSLVFSNAIYILLSFSTISRYDSVMTRQWTVYVSQSQREAPQIQQVFIQLETTHFKPLPTQFPLHRIHNMQISSNTTRKDALWGFLFYCSNKISDSLCS